MTIDISNHWASKPRSDKLLARHEPQSHVPNKMVVALEQAGCSGGFGPSNVREQRWLKPFWGNWA
jgi:hypothetical protein